MVQVTHNGALSNAQAQLELRSPRHPLRAAASSGPQRLHGRRKRATSTTGKTMVEEARNASDLPHYLQQTAVLGPNWSRIFLSETVRELRAKFSQPISLFNI